MARPPRQHRRIFWGDTNASFGGMLPCTSLFSLAVGFLLTRVRLPALRVAHTVSVTKGWGGTDFWCAQRKVTYPFVRRPWDWRGCLQLAGWGDGDYEWDRCGWVMTCAPRLQAACTENGYISGCQLQPGVGFLVPGLVWQSKLRIWPDKHGSQENRPTTINTR